MSVSKHSTNCDEMAALSPDEYFLVNESAILCLQDIVSLDAEGNYTKITDMRGRHHMLRKPLHKCQERLPTSQFFKVCRDCIVNLAHVEKVGLHDRKRLMVKLDDGQEIIFSRLQTRQFRASYSL